MKDPTNNEERMRRLITLVRAVPPVFHCCQGLDAGLIKAVGGGGPEMQPLLTTCGPLGRARPLRIHYRGLTHTDVVARLLALPLHPQDQTDEAGGNGAAKRGTKQRTDVQVYRKYFPFFILFFWVCLFVWLGFFGEFMTLQSWHFRNRS